MILEIVSPEAKLFSGEVTSVSVPGVDGDFQMLNNHAAIVSILGKGNVKVVAQNVQIKEEFESKFKLIEYFNEFKKDWADIIVGYIAFIFIFSGAKITFSDLLISNVIHKQS